MAEESSLPALRGVDVVDEETGEVLVGEVVGESFNPAKWQDNVDLAMSANQQITEFRLVIGAVVENVVQRWGKRGEIGDVMKRFALDSGIAVSTLYEYRRVHKAFPEGGPAELDYSHLRTAIGAGTSDGSHIEAAEEAAEQGLTTRSMQRRQKEREEEANEDHGAAEDVTGKTMPCPTCHGTGEVPA